MDISKAKEVFDAAVADVKALAVGSKFLGVMPMAEARGYKRGSQEYGLYISVAVDALPDELYMDGDDCIAEMSTPKCLNWSA